MLLKILRNKIKQTTDEYINTILPPLTKALFKYVREGKYTFCTPGHMGGTAFQKSPVGSLFYDFFGPNTMKSDISISVSETGFSAGSTAVTQESRTVYRWRL
ncbi:hypothetical protein ACLB1T_14575 [Escherichia coli]